MENERTGRWMLYGANGYTGGLMIEEAIRRGHRPVLAGRTEKSIAPLAEKYELDYEVFDLGDVALVARKVAGVGIVFHAAGPFSWTAAPMVQACLISGTHYLDITGELSVFEYVLGQHDAARDRGIALIPGAGFDVVPSDCLCVYVAQQVPGANQLELGINAISTMSAGTTNTMLEHLSNGVVHRRDGHLVQSPIGAGVRTIRFAHKDRTAMMMPWGDISTAYRSTGIPNITTWVAYPPATIRMYRRTGWMGRMAMAVTPLRRVFQRYVSATVKGPDENLREKGRTYLWAKATSADGTSAEAWMQTVEAYRYTAEVGVLAVERLQKNPVSGALTPAQAFGTDFALDVPGTQRFDSLPRD